MLSAAVVGISERRRLYMDADINWLEQMLLQHLFAQMSWWQGKKLRALCLSPRVFRINSDIEELFSGVSWDFKSYGDLSSDGVGDRFDLVVAHLAPPDLAEQQALWSVLSPMVNDAAGLFFSSWGQGTLSSLAPHVAKLDVPISMSFHDMHDMGDQLAKFGWTDAVMSQFEFSVNYDHQDLCREDMDIVGLGSVLSDVEMKSVLDSMAIAQDNVFMCHYDVAIGHAVYNSKTAGNCVDGEVQISVDALRRSLRELG